MDTVVPVLSGTALSMGVSYGVYKLNRWIVGNEDNPVCDRITNSAAIMLGVFSALYLEYQMNPDLINEVDDVSFHFIQLPLYVSSAIGVFAARITDGFTMEVAEPKRVM